MSTCVSGRKPLKTNTNTIDSKSQYKDLGVILTSDLNWTPHYNLIIGQAYKILGLIHRSFISNSYLVKKQLYISLVRSQIMYCSQLWRPHLIHYITTLERIQRRATKFILNNYSMDSKNRLQYLRLLPLMYVYELNDLIFLSSHTRHLLPTLTSGSRGGSRNFREGFLTSYH